MALHKTRTVRFNQEELRRIEEFLSKNPFLDFSSLARLAISSFIERPSVEIKAISALPKGKASIDTENRR